MSCLVVTKIWLWRSPLFWPLIWLSTGFNPTSRRGFWHSRRSPLITGSVEKPSPPSPMKATKSHKSLSLLAASPASSSVFKKHIFKKHRTWYFFLLCPVCSAFKKHLFVSANECQNREICKQVCVLLVEWVLADQTSVQSLMTYFGRKKIIKIRGYYLKMGQNSHTY